MRGPEVLYYLVSQMTVGSCLAVKNTFGLIGLVLTAVYEVQNKKACAEVNAEAQNMLEGPGQVEDLDSIIGPGVHDFRLKGFGLVKIHQAIRNDDDGIANLSFAGGSSVEADFP